MGSASIRIDQPAHPTVPIGQPGIARDDLVLSSPVTARNSDDTDVLRWVWALVDKPLGSTATLSGTTSPTVTFTPDVAGSYLLRLSVNDGLEGQIDEKIAAVRTSLGIRYPATNEVASMTNWPGNDLKGWGKDTEQILRGQVGPQSLMGAADESVVVAASVVITIGGLGYPATLADIVDWGFVDIGGGAVGLAPTVNGFAFGSLPGSGGKSVDTVDIDLDTSASVAGDQWAMVIGVASLGDILGAKITIV